MNGASDWAFSNTLHIQRLAVLQDETDACWFESLHMDDLSLGSDAFTRTARLEAEAYF